MSRSSQLGLVAAKQAVSESMLEDKDVEREEVGVLAGSSIGGYAAAKFFISNFHKGVRASPFTTPISMNIGPASNLSIKYGFQGPLMNVDAACSTAAHSIGNAFNLIRSGCLGSYACAFNPGRFSSGGLPSL